MRVVICEMVPKMGGSEQLTTRVLGVDDRCPFCNEPLRYHEGNQYITVFIRPEDLESLKEELEEG